MSLIEKEGPTVSSGDVPPEAEVRKKVVIADGMAELQSLDKPTIITTCAHLAEHFTEIERILKETALTANSDDPNDREPLKPAHQLMQRKTICLPPGVFEKTGIYRKKWRQVQFLANLFSERWLKEYIPTLQQRGKWRRVLPNIKPDALVLLVNDNTPRAHGISAEC